MRRGRAERARYTMQRYPDGSERAERVMRSGERYEEQVLEDFYGEKPLLPTGAHVRSIKSLLAEVSSKLRVQEEEYDTAMLRDAWSKAVGEYLAEHAQLVSLASGRAVIASSHPAVRFELQHQKTAVIAALNRELGENCVRQLRLVQR